MTTAWVLDSSVILKWFFQHEILAERALALRAAFFEGRARVLVPPLLVYEVANALRYKQTMTQAQIALSLESLLNMHLDWVAPTGEVMRRTTTIARTYDTSIYDAAFVAVAERVDADFITADERLVRRLRALPYVAFLGDFEVPA